MRNSPFTGSEPGHVPGSGLIRALAGAALATSAFAAAALAAALAAPTEARAETAGQHFGPAASMDERADFAAHPDRLPAMTLPVAASRAPVAQFRVEADDGTVSTIYHLRDYDLRLEAGTVFYRTAAVPGQPSNPGLLRGRVMSRVVTRF
ncbi:hypothetical protein ACFOD9_02550 [Novosphingobium bradum]|uniref:Uncharacterized protein n=1 Tax=Novosphingobium bradum TaxID=1737444 RepID=A0ABV7ING2_9SPHN